MEPHKIANILFYMSLDMDYADALESANEEIDCIARDLEFLKQNGRDVILQALEMIAMENESIPEKWNNKGYKRTLSCKKGWDNYGFTENCENIIQLIFRYGLCGFFRIQR